MAAGSPELLSLPLALTNSAAASPMCIYVVYMQYSMYYSEEGYTHFESFTISGTTCNASHQWFNDSNMCIYNLYGNGIKRNESKSSTTVYSHCFLTQMLPS